MYICNRLHFFWCTSGKLDAQGNFRGSLVQPRHPLDGSLMSAGHPKQFSREFLEIAVRAGMVI